MGTIRYMVAATTTPSTSWQARTTCSITGDNVAHGGDWIVLTGSIYGGPGNDLLEPIGEGEVSGGPGADLILAPNEKRNTIPCGASKDTVYFEEALDSPAADCERQVPHQFTPPNNEPFSS
jgi:hypothetical protein